jgi:hypothetical protein
VDTNVKVMMVLKVIAKNASVMYFTEVYEHNSENGQDGRI